MLGRAVPTPWLGNWGGLPNAVLIQSIPCSDAAIVRAWSVAMARLMRAAVAAIRTNNLVVGGRSQNRNSRRWLGNIERVFFLIPMGIHFAVEPCQVHRVNIALEC